MTRLTLSWAGRSVATWLGLALLSMSLGGTCLHAQTVTVTHSPDPDSLAVGDSVKTTLSLGTPGDRARNVVKITGTHTFPGFAVEDSVVPALDVSEGWMCQDGNCSTSVTIAADGRSFDYLIERTDGVGQTGDGPVGVLTHFVVVEVEIMWDRLGQSRAETVEVVQAPHLLLGYDHAARRLRIRDRNGEAHFQAVRLYDLNGRAVQQWTLDQGPKVALPVGSHPGGIYLCEVITTQGQYRQKLYLR